MQPASTKLRLIVAALIAVAVVVLALIASRQGLSLTALQASRAEFVAYDAMYPWRSATLFFLVYTLVTAASLPFAALMTLAAGAVFGLVESTLLVSFSSTLGATLAMLAGRFVLRDWVRRHGGARVQRFDDQLRHDGGYYLFSLRLVPAVPFVLVNLLAGLSPIRVATYWWVSQLGMLPATVVYANAGQHLGELSSFSGLLSPPLIVSLLLLAALPWLARWALAWLRRVPPTDGAA